MANIPTGIDAQLESDLGRGLNIPQGGAEAFGMAGRHVAQQVRVATEGVANVANQIERHQVIQETSDLNDGAGNLELQARDGFKQAIAADPKTDPTEYFNDHVAPGLDKLSETATTEQGRAHFAELRTKLHVGLLTEWGAERSRLDSDSAVNAADGAYQQAGNIVADNPASLGMQLDLVHSKIAAQFKAAGVPLDKSDRHFAEQDANLAYAAADGIARVAESPKTTSPIQIAAARDAINDPASTIYKTLPFEKRQAINDRLNTAEATQGNIAAAVQDVQRPLLLDAVRNGDPKAYDTLTAMSQNPKGDTPQARAVYSAEILRDRDEAKGFAQGAQTISNMPEADARHLVESMPLEGARTEAQKGVVAAYKDRVEGLNKDPMGWIASHNQTAANAYSAWQQNPSPQTWANFALTQTAIQKRLRPDQPVHLLTPETKAQAQDIVRSITQTPEGAAGASKSLYSMAQTFGDSWHSIAHDLMDEHVLSREQYAAARLYGDPAKQGEGERILSASAMKAGDRFDVKGIPEAKARKEAQTALQSFSDSLGNVNDRADVIAGFTDALTHVLQVNGDPNNLTSLAQSEAQKMLLSEYSFAGATHTIRVPSGVDADSVTAESSHALDAIDKRDLVIPVNRSGTLNPENQAENYKRTVQLTARWYTNEDGSGIKLYDQDMHNVMERKGGKAIPVSMSWAELTRNAKARAETAGATGAVNIASYQGR